MRGLLRLNPSAWSVRERLIAAAGLVVFAIALLAAGRGLASGAAGEILRVRFGGDAERTRVVVDLDASTRGQVIRAGDDQWFHIVQWTLFGLINAEETGVTSANIGSLAATKTHRIRRLLGLEGTFGPSIGLDRLFISNVIKAVGNYGEIFERNFGPSTGAAVVRGQNALWSNGGLLWAPPVE